MISMQEQHIDATAMIHARFWSKVDVGHRRACWLWRGADNGVGYGVFTPSKPTQVYAHRFAYELLIGPIPDGLTLDHLCRTPLCVNPLHLEPVTLGENVLRGESPPARNARRTHCKRGHLLDGYNLYITPNGSRDCRICKAAATARYRARQKERTS